jgi:hypothetical protein
LGGFAVIEPPMSVKSTVASMRSFSASSPGSDTKRAPGIIVAEPDSE